MKNRFKLLIASLFAGLSLGVLSGVKFATKDNEAIQTSAGNTVYWRQATSVSDVPDGADVLFGGISGNNFYYANSITDRDTFTTSISSTYCTNLSNNTSFLAFPGTAVSPFRAIKSGNSLIIKDTSVTSENYLARTLEDWGGVQYCYGIDSDPNTATNGRLGYVSIDNYGQPYVYFENTKLLFKMQSENKRVYWTNKSTASGKDYSTIFRMFIKCSSSTITFDQGGGKDGTISASSYSTKDTSQTVTFTAPTKTGYNSPSYSIQRTGTTGGAAPTISGKTVTIPAGSYGAFTINTSWKASTYTITFDALGGTGGTVATTATYDNDLPTITVPTKTGYTFDGYFTAANGAGTQYYNAQGGSIRKWDKTSATTLYAKWLSNSDWKLLTSSTTTIDSGYYYINSDVSITNTVAGGSGLTINEYSNVRIYIPAGYTLKCQGGNGSYATGGGAGIHLPSSSSLYIYGGGTISAYGGKAGNGSDGEAGRDGSLTFSALKYSSGAGGAGGAGGGGGGAGIGTPGATGGRGGRVGEYNGVKYSSSKEAARDKSNAPGYAGEAGAAGGTAAKTGKIYIESSINIDAVAGAASNVAGKAGAAGKSIADKSTGWTNYHTGGGGAGGAGGGSGYAGNNIGPGGRAGGGGGSGGGGYCVCSTKWYISEAFGGKGGTGYASGSNGSNACSTTLYQYNNFNVTVTSTSVYSSYANKGASGGAGGGSGTRLDPITPTSSTLSYSITYLNEDDSVYSTASYNVSSATTIELPSLTNYGWKVATPAFSCEGTSSLTTTGNLITSSIVTANNVYGDIVLKAFKIVYTITFDAAGGTLGTSSIEATYGNAVPSITLPNRSGYSFGGFYAGENGTGTQYYGSTGTSTNDWDIASDTTLHAKWTPNTYHVSLDSQGGTGGDTTVDTVFNQAVPAVNVPTKTGYIFQGYYSELNGSGIQYINGDGSSTGNAWTTASDNTIYGYWMSNTINVDYYDEGGVEFSGVHVGDVMSFDYDKGLTLDTPTKQYFTFEGYYLNSDCSGSVITRLEAFSYANDVKLYAKWVKTLSDFADEFLDLTGSYCSGDKSFTDTLKNSFNMLSANDKETFIDTEVVEGLGNTYSSDIVEAKSRYYNMVTERGFDQFLEGMNVQPMSKSLFNTTTFFGIEEEDIPEVSTAAVLVVLGGFSVGAYFLLKKKKFN